MHQQPTFLHSLIERDRASRVIVVERRRLSDIRAEIERTGRSVRVDGGVYGLSYAPSGRREICFIPD